MRRLLAALALVSPALIGCWPATDTRVPLACPESVPATGYISFNRVYLQPRGGDSWQDLITPAVREFGAPPITRTGLLSRYPLVFEGAPTERPLYRMTTDQGNLELFLHASKSGDLVHEAWRLELTPLARLALGAVLEEQTVGCLERLVPKLAGVKSVTISGRLGHIPPAVQVNLDGHGLVASITWINFGEPERPDPALGDKPSSR